MSTSHNFLKSKSDIQHWKHYIMTLTSWHWHPDIDNMTLTSWHWHHAIDTMTLTSQAQAWRCWLNARSLSGLRWMSEFGIWSTCFLSKCYRWNHCCNIIVVSIVASNVSSYGVIICTLTSLKRLDQLTVQIWRLLLKHMPGRPNYDQEWSIAHMWSPRLWCMMFYSKYILFS